MCPGGGSVSGVVSGGFCWDPEGNSLISIWAVGRLPVENLLFSCDSGQFGPRTWAGAAVWQKSAQRKKQKYPEQSAARVRCGPWVEWEFGKVTMPIRSALDLESPIAVDGQVGLWKFDGAVGAAIKSDPTVLSGLEVDKLTRGGCGCGKHGLQASA